MCLVGKHEWHGDTLLLKVNIIANQIDLINKLFLSYLLIIYHLEICKQVSSTNYPFFFQLNHLFSNYTNIDIKRPWKLLWSRSTHTVINIERSNLKHITAHTNPTAPDLILDTLYKYPSVVSGTTLHVFQLSHLWIPILHPFQLMQYIFLAR